ncbi:unnamed protein product, partial [marine sediment metagenome]
LVDTPRRVVAALKEMTQGRHQDPAKILATVFDEPCDEMVVLRDIPFVSLCEHHMLPFAGTVDIGYLPGDTVVGLSKLARLVDCFAQRLQIQERLTQQVATAIDEQLQPVGVGVIVRANHACMSCRGVRKHDTTMVTSSLLGAFRNGDARHEFLSLARSP